MQIWIIRIGCSARLRVCALGCRRPGFVHHVEFIDSLKLNSGKSGGRDAD